MLSDIANSLIGLVGGLLAALLVARHQAKNTKAVIATELNKLEKQNQSAFRSRKEQWLLDTAPNLLAAWIRSCMPHLITL